MLVSLTVRDIMAETVRTTTPDATARDVARRLREHDVGSLVVCDGSRAVGIVTESDLVRLAGEGRDLDAVRVSTFMSGDLRTIDPAASIEAAARRLGEADFRRLPVVEDGDLVGIVTSQTLATYLPYVATNRRAWAEHHRFRPASGSTAYEDREWEFERHDAPPEGESVSVGDRVRFTKTLSATDVEAFAEASGDTNRLHLDEAFAERSRFGGRIAHGILTAGVISAALARLPGQTVYLSQELSFLGPVRLGDRITAECEVVEELGRNRFRLTTTVFDGEDAVLDGEAVVLVEPLPDDGPADAGEEATATPGEGD
jgi:acyl dehydratase/CBS domain-containing protein